jgi:hypothetical protein
LMMVTSGSVAAPETAGSVEPATPAEPVQMAETAEPVKPVKAAKPGKSVDGGPTETTAPLETPSVPLKAADKVQKPSFETVPDGHPVSTPNP